MKNLSVAILALLVSACGSAKASGPSYAQEIGSPSSGVRCFAIYNQSGDAVGGNCVKE
jgi:hypothetical protein